MITFITNMAVAELLNYREFDREKSPAPLIPFIQSYTVDQVTEWVETNTMEPVELSIFEDKALLTDGNHRIVAVNRLGHSVVPVKVTIFDTIDELKAMFYDHTIQRFKLIA